MTRATSCNFLVQLPKYLEYIWFNVLSCFHEFLRALFTAIYKVLRKM